MKRILVQLDRLEQQVSLHWLVNDETNRNRLYLHNQHIRPTPAKSEVIKLQQYHRLFMNIISDSQNKGTYI